MFHYNLRCDEGHEFDSWFNTSASFEKQAKRGLLECPHCGSADGAVVHGEEFLVTSVDVT